MGKVMYLRKGDVHTAPSISKLPSGYMALSCIESTGTQYIDTGWTFGSNNVNARIISDSIVGTGNDSWVVSGVGAGTCLYYGCGNGTRNIYYGNGGGDISTGVAYNESRCVFDVNLKDKSVTVTDVATGSKLVNLTNITISTPSKASAKFYLFGRYKADGSAAVLISERIYSYQIYDNGTLVRDFLPCMSDTGEVGLYDIVNKRFYGNAGTGTFTGSEVE